MCERTDRLDSTVDIRESKITDMLDSREDILLGSTSLIVDLDISSSMRLTPARPGAGIGRALMNFLRPKSQGGD